MSYSDVELIILGSRFSTQRLLEQGAVSVAVARAHSEELGGSFPSGKIDELEGYLT